MFLEMIRFLSSFLPELFYIFRMTVHGETLNEFTHSSLQEPTHLAVDTKKNNIIVSDSVNCSVLVFNIIGELLFIVCIFFEYEIVSRFSYILVLIGTYF